MYHVGFVVISLLLSQLSVEATVAKWGKSCPQTTRPCNDGTCLPQRWFCDGEVDCNNGEDESPYNCQDVAPPPPVPVVSSPSCPSGQFGCDYKCLPNIFRCNGAWDCRDGTDEKNCAPIPPVLPVISPTIRPPTQCSYDEFACDYKCIDIRFRCDGLQHCSDNIDELHCAVTPSPVEQSTCAEGEVQCYDGKCISLYNICDGFAHCKYEEDEFACALRKDKIFTHRCVEKCLGIIRPNCNVTDSPIGPIISTTTTLAPLATCQRGFVLVHDRCINVVSHPPETWEWAREACLLNDSHLVEIDDGNFFVALVDHLNASDYQPYSYWTGANDKQYEDRWLWDNSKTLVHRGAPLWALYKEDGIFKQSPKTGNGERCGVLENCPNRYLDDETCEKKYPFICQREITYSAQY